MVVSKLKNFYHKYDRHIGTLTIIIGFIFDNLSLRNASINTQTQVFLLYLILSAFSILFIHFLESKEGRKEKLETLYFWVFLLVSFCITI